MKVIKNVVVFLFFLSGLTFGFPVQAQLLSATVIKVIDGDSFVVTTEDGELEIRLNGIDCPEYKQAFGKEASEKTNKLLFKRIKFKVTGLDKYGRTLADVWYNDVWYNELLVANGYAWHYKKYSDDAELASAETKARASRLGIWKSDNPIPPWEWRLNNGNSFNSKIQQTSNSTGYQQNNNQIRNTKETGTNEVVICGGQYAKKYHSKLNCRGLQNCKGEIKKITLKEAQKIRRTPCKICYSS